MDGSLLAPRMNSSRESFPNKKKNVFSVIKCTNQSQHICKVLTLSIRKFTNCHYKESLGKWLGFAASLKVVKSRLWWIIIVWRDFQI